MHSLIKSRTLTFPNFIYELFDNAIRSIKDSQRHCRMALFYYGLNYIYLYYSLIRLINYIIMELFAIIGLGLIIAEIEYYFIKGTS